MTTTPAPLPTNTSEEIMMSWLDHARELRNRLVKASLAVFIGLVISFFIVQYDNFAVVSWVIIHFVGENGLQTTEVAEAFTNTIQIALGMGIVMAMPVLVYQLLAFVVPGLTRREQRIIFTTLPFILMCFVAGLLFGWFVTVPAAIRWLVGFGSPLIENKPTFDNFRSFFVRLMLANGIIFELPIIVYTLIWLGVVERKSLTQYRRYAALIIIIVAAIITPTSDPVNLSLVAIPMYLLYELGLLLALVAPRKKAAPPTLNP